MIRNIKLILLLFLFGTLSVVGQKSNTRIGFKLLPGLTGSYVPNEPQQIQNSIYPRFTFNFGVLYIRGIKDSLLFIETGLYYSDRGGLQKDVTIEYGGENGPTTSDIYSHSYYLTLPFLLRMEFKHFYASIGPTFDFYTHTKYVWTPMEDKIERSNYVSGGFFSRFKIGAVLNVGTQIKLTDKLGLFIEGSFNPSEFQKDQVSEKYLFFMNYLLGVGITYNLHKNLP